MLHFAPEKIFKFRLKGLQRLEYHTADLSQPGTTFSVDIENTPFNTSKKSIYQNPATFKNKVE